MGNMLLVDDNTSLARFTARHLQRAFPELTITLAGTCAGALQAAKSFVPDILLVDRRLPDGDGAELAVELSQRHEHMTSVVTSASLPSDFELRTLLGERGHALQKPFEVDQLLSVVGEALGNQSRPTAPAPPRNKQPVGYDSHEVRNRLAALLAGIRAFSEEVRHSAPREQDVLEVVAEYEEVLVSTIYDLRRLLRDPPEPTR